MEQEEEENINQKLIEGAVLTAPLSLLSIKNENLIKTANSYLPYSIGIEVECNQKKNFNLANFKSIPDILKVNCDSGEQRFRIPNGILGLVCLYNISEQLKLNSLLNPDSGIHYHCDMTNSFHLLNSKIVEENEEWILKELDKWNYPGNYNKRQCKFSEGHNWIRFQSSFKTAEFRIGEMTFDYEVLIKRILHICEIIKKLNTNIKGIFKIYYGYEKFDMNKIDLILKYIKFNYTVDKNNKYQIRSNVNEIINNRIVDVYGN